MEEKYLNRALAFSFVSQAVLLSIIEKFGGIALTLIIVRILSPEDFGEFALASSIILFMMTMSVERFAEIVFHSSGSKYTNYAQHFGFSIALHGVISGIILVTAFYLSTLEKYDGAAPLLALGAAAPLLNAPRIIYSVSLKRDLNWKRIRFLSLSAFFLSFSVTLTLALMGAGAFALIVQILIKPLPFIADMIIRRRDLFSVRFPSKEYMATLKFGGLRVAGAGAMQARTLLENFVIAGALGTATLGIYGRAFGLGQITVGWLSGQFSTIVYPMIARFAPETDTFQRSSGMLLRLSLWCSLPPALTVSSAEHETVFLLFGANWVESAQYVTPMVVLVVSLTLLNAVNLIGLVALGAKFSFVVQFLTLITSAFALFFVLPTSLMSYAWAFCLGCSAIGVFSLMYLTKKRVLNGRDTVRLSVPAMISLLIIFAVDKLTDLRGSLDILPDWLLIISLLSLNSLLLVVLVRFLDKEGLRDGLQYFPEKLRIIILRIVCLSPEQKRK